MVLQHRLRLYLIALLLIAGFTSLLSKLWDVQITRHGFYQEQVPGNTPVTISVPGVRGEILDRNGVPLATNAFEYNIILNLKDIESEYKRLNPKAKPVEYTVTDDGFPKTLRETDIVEAVRQIVVEPLKEHDLEIAFPERELRMHFRGTQGLVPYVLYHGLTYKQYAELAEQEIRILGTQLEAKPLRRYVYGSLAGHVLGYEAPADLQREMDELKGMAQGEGDEAELARRELNYTYYVPNTWGVAGIEKAMNGYLKGRSGLREYVKNQKDQIIKQTNYDPPKPGYDVVLTLDLHAQYVVEKAMRKVGQGAAVVLDPNTGYILAMVSVPSYDPNAYIPSITQETYDRYRTDATKPLINRAVYPFAPGSTFKIPIAIAGTKKDLHGKAQFCNGAWSRSSRPIKCLGTHHSLKLREAIMKSCNCFFCNYGYQTGIELIEETTKMMGLGERVGLPIFEPGGMLVPSPKRLQEYAPGDKWSDHKTALVSIGQGGVAVSPLQMANVAAIAANRGTVYQPQLIARIQDQDGSSVKTFEPIVLNRLTDHGYKAEDIERVREGMKDVVNAPGGTARRAKLDNIVVAGKTGTAQYTNAKDDNHAWFICFAPYDNPRYAVCVFVERGASGGKVAAPLARKILEELFRGPSGSPAGYPALAEAPGGLGRHEEIVFENEPLLPAGEEDTADSAVALEDAGNKAVQDSRGEMIGEKPASIKERSKLIVRERNKRNER